MSSLYFELSAMSFSERVVLLRKQHNLTQQGLADATGIHVQQIKHYESGRSQPTAEMLKKLALALHVTTDFLLFEDGERDPQGDWKLLFEGLNAMTPADQAAAKSVLDAMIVRSQVTEAVERVKSATKEKKSGSS